jgi:hypothetical protein
MRLRLVSALSALLILTAANDVNAQATTKSNLKWLKQKECTLPMPK